MSALDNALAPYVQPDVESDEYQAALRILEDHPDTRGMEPGRRSSLAQQLVDEVTKGLRRQLQHARANAAEWDEGPGSLEWVARGIAAERSEIEKIGRDNLAAERAANAKGRTQPAERSGGAA